MWQLRRLTASLPLSGSCRDRVQLLLGSEVYQLAWIVSSLKIF